MKIYLAHAKQINYQKNLYEPIRNSPLNAKHSFILPHENSDKPFNSKEFLENTADLLIAEVSCPATGLGIELGWADIFDVPIVCIYQKNSKIAGSLRVVSENFIEYSNSAELIDGIEKVLEQIDS